MGCAGALAAAAGYSDQAHLARECRRLSGLTPTGLFELTTPIVGDRMSESFKTAD
jgi:AraC-like DNA-binding protein